MRVFAETSAGGTSRSNSKNGQATIAANMKKAGASQKQINAAQKRAAKLPNARTQRL